MTEHDINDVGLTPPQRSLFEVVNTIPAGRWSAYSDVGEALVQVGAMSATTNRGALGRGAASIEDSLRLRLAAYLGVAAGGEDVGTPFGYPWWRVRNDDGRLVEGGIGRDRLVIADSAYPGNSMLRDEGGTVVGGGYASQHTRFDVARAKRPKQTVVDDLCHQCFLRPCQCENAP